MMRGSLTVVRVDASTTRVEFDRTPTLRELQTAIDGGFLEIVPGFNRHEGEACVVFCDEEGKLKGLPANVQATAAWRICAQHRDVLHGTVVVCKGDDEFMGLL